MARLTGRKKSVQKEFFIFLAFLVMLVASPSLIPAQKEDKVLTLPLGQAEYRGKFVEMEPGKLYSMKSGKPLKFEQMIKEMKKARFIHLGETHDNLDMHDWQLRIIESLYRQDPDLAIGLEQVTVDLQSVLDRWVSGELEEENFLKEIRWYVTWNFNYNYYKNIFDLARKNKIPIIALNAPRNLISKVRMQGYESLTEEEKKIIPPLDLTNQDHRLLIKTIFESEEIPTQMKGVNLEASLEGLYRAQVAWDETMGRKAVMAAEATGKRVVVLAGSGHLLYNLGLNHRAWKLSRQPMATVIGVEVPENSRLRVARGLADYVYGVAKKDYPAYPAPGLNLKKVEGLTNLVVGASPTEPLTREAGFQKGDVILAVGTESVSEVNDFRMILARYGWGEEVEIKVLRNGEVLTLTLKFNPELLKKNRKPETGN